MTAYESLFTTDQKKLTELTDQRLFFLNFLSQDQREQAVIHFIKNNLFHDEIREFFHDKPEFIIRMSHRCGWEVNRIVRFILPNHKESDIAFTALRSYVISLLFQENKVDTKGCKKRPQLLPKSELEIFLGLKILTNEKIISILDVNKDYTEDELCKIINHIINKVYTLQNYFFLLRIEKRYHITLNYLRGIGYYECIIDKFIESQI